ncbi:MAG: hypothetical protein HYU67_13885 [Flavobacteriia bacterium]|nr:hypothetical protein [Flavobacteriia bacterium]
MDINEILKNDTVKSLLSKTGLSEKQVNDVIKQAVGFLGEKFKTNPLQMGSLLSSNPNTPEDEDLSSKLKNEFSKKLTTQHGFTADKANSIKETMPKIVSEISKSMTKKGVNNQNGLENLFQNATHFLGNKENQRQIMGAVQSIFGSFFKKK